MMNKINYIDLSILKYSIKTIYDMTNNNINPNLKNYEMKILRNFVISLYLCAFLGVS